MLFVTGLEAVGRRAAAASAGDDFESLLRYGGFCLFC